MNKRNVILTGIPRSGTTLACHLLQKLPETVALHEPVDLTVYRHLTNHRPICEGIGRFFDEMRDSIETRQIAISRHSDGTVPDNPFSDEFSESGLRKHVNPRGEIRIEKALGPDFLLVIKQNQIFTAVLESLIQHFPCHAIIRNPLSVLGSWSTVAIPAHFGLATSVERLDPGLAERIEPIQDAVERQLCLLSWYYEKYLRVLPQESILRYEDIVATGGKALRIVAPEAAQLNERLETKNKNKLYDAQLLRQLGSRLLNSGGAYWDFYSRESVEELLRD
jgi:ribosome-associated protein YbcJ (S4-like RNA binding protein)